MPRHCWPHRRAVSIGLECTWEGTQISAEACAVSVTLTPIPYTQKLMGKRLRGKTVKDLPMPVVHEYIKDAPVGPLDWTATLAVADGSAPVVGALDDGTPVMFTGDRVHVAVPTGTMAVLHLQMESAFWYNLVDFDFRATFTPAKLAAP